MNEWKVPHWPPTYRDNTELHPIILVDSHQLDDSGKQSGRYKKITPWQAFVSANELTDKLCSVTLGGEKKNPILSYLETPKDIRYPPNALRFTFTHMGKTMNGDTPNRIEELVRESFWMAAARTQEQGRMFRMLEKVISRLKRLDGKEDTATCADILHDPIRKIGTGMRTTVHGT
jgi:hypothetical protein